MYNTILTLPIFLIPAFKLLFQVKKLICFKRNVRYYTTI